MYTCVYIYIYIYMYTPIHIPIHIPIYIYMERERERERERLIRIERLKMQAFIDLLAHIVVTGQSVSAFCIETADKDSMQYTVYMYMYVSI